MQLTSKCVTFIARYPLIGLVFVVLYVVFLWLGAISVFEKYGLLHASAFVLMMAFCVSRVSPCLINRIKAAKQR
ncbi:hypothetical protein K0504_09695 [Neiella marina]|uniref:Uncharacterized protein n=1 Tax=Neiella holothuriorum TaxID=2870530 RepID=A0ABS7EGI0_9GAMM|nr:hypothetical protein [Neiella holothuriorum]MBW8191309.1 hypothetical protein [Neiella holothuriorum]